MCSYNGILLRVKMNTLKLQAARMSHIHFWAEKAWHTFVYIKHQVYEVLDVTTGPFREEQRGDDREGILRRLLENLLSWSGQWLQRFIHGGIPGWFVNFSVSMLSFDKTFFKKLGFFFKKRPIKTITVIWRVEKKVIFLTSKIRFK